MFFDDEFWEEITGEAGYQKRIYRFYIRRLETLSRDKLEKEFESARKQLIVEKVVKPKLLKEALAELRQNGWPLLKMTAYLKVLSLDLRT